MANDTDTALVRSNWSLSKKDINKKNTFEMWPLYVKSNQKTIKIFLIWI